MNDTVSINEYNRLKRRLDKKAHRIQGMQKKIDRLEMALGRRTIDL